MNYPPSLTWMHLSPRERALVAVGVPDWLRAGLTRATTDAQRCGTSEAIVSETLEHALSVHRDAGAVAIINPNRGEAQRVRTEGGFSHVSRFAVLPNLRHARWFIPLDSRRTAAASFCIYTPSKRSAILRRSVARILARLGVRGWYRDEVLVARTDVSPLERLLRDTLGTSNLHVALSAGAPEPALNRKCTAAAIADDGTVLAFAKVALGPLARSLVMNEHQVLTALATRPGSPRGLPAPLFGGDCAGNFTLIQKPLSGKPAGAKFSSQHRSFLDALVIGPNRPLAQSRIVSTIFARAERIGAAADPLRPLLAQLARLGPTVAVPVVVTHGDFAPWNLLACDDGLCAFDWEYGNDDSVPLVDETNHRVQVAHLIEKRSAAWTLAMLDAVSSYDPTYPPDVARLLQHVSILDVTARLLAEGYDTTNEMVAWYLDLIAKLAKRDGVPEVTR